MTTSIAGKALWDDAIFSDDEAESKSPTEGKPKKPRVCRYWLRNKCTREDCQFSHQTAHDDKGEQSIDCTESKVTDILEAELANLNAEDRKKPYRPTI